jgi:AbrB family looped-hinge helix DNA binding protein
LSPPLSSIAEYDGNEYSLRKCGIITEIQEARMTTVVISERGQVTVPAKVRKAAGIGPGTRVEVEVRGREVVLKPLPSIRELAGVFHEYAVGKTTDWHEIREQAMTAMAAEVAREGLE